MKALAIVIFGREKNSHAIYLNTNTWTISILVKVAPSFSFQLVAEADPARPQIWTIHKYKNFKKKSNVYIFNGTSIAFRSRIDL